MSNDPAAFDSSDQATVDNTAKEAARRDQEDIETVRIWLTHPHGRSLLWRLMDECNIFGDPRRETTHDTYFELGMQNFGKNLLQRVQKHPDLYGKMVAEAQIDEDLRKSRLEKANKNQD